MGAGFENHLLDAETLFLDNAYGARIQGVIRIRQPADALQKPRPDIPLMLFDLAYGPKPIPAFIPKAEGGFRTTVNEPGQLIPGIVDIETSF
jgi:hypothetical protein